MVLEREDIRFQSLNTESKKIPTEEELRNERGWLISLLSPQMVTGEVIDALFDEGLTPYLSNDYLDTHSVASILPNKELSIFEKYRLRRESFPPPVEEDLDALVKDNIIYYKQRVALIPPLSSKQEIELGRGIKILDWQISQVQSGEKTLEKFNILRRAHTKKQELVNVLVESNTRLVFTIAQKYYGRGIAFSDLKGYGHEGLIAAAQKFDYRQGNKFGTYATWWIRQSISHAFIWYSRLIRIPDHMRSKAMGLWIRISQAEQNGEVYSLEKLAKEVELSMDDLKLLMPVVPKPASFAQQVGEHEDDILGDLIPGGIDPENHVFENMMVEDVNWVLDNCLTERQRTALRLRFGIGYEKEHDYGEIGSHIGFKRERSRQEVLEALRLLNNPEVRKRLRDYLE